MNQTVRDQLTRARAALILDQPFFGILALRLRLEEKLDIPTLATDGVSVFYNPNFVASLSPSLTKSAMGHEVGHPLFQHIGRRGDRNPQKWNRAGDYVVNAMLKKSGFELGKDWLYDPKYDGMSTDQIYNLLPDLPEDKDDSLCQIMDGPPQPSEEDGTPAPTIEELERDWKIATVQAATAAKEAGKLPAGMERFIDKLVAPQVDWVTMLRRFVTQTNKDDISWARPNRRMLDMGFYIPTLYSENMGDIVVAIDTSGSVDAHTLKIFGSELSAIVSEVRPANVHVIYCDCRINKVVSFTPDESFKLEAVGGGGTAFKPVADYIEKHGITPVCLVYLTDLYGPSNFPEPAYPWLWCTTGETKAQWGEILEIKL